MACSCDHLIIFLIIKTKKIGPFVKSKIFQNYEIRYMYSVSNKANLIVVLIYSLTAFCLISVNKSNDTCSPKKSSKFLFFFKITNCTGSYDTRNKIFKVLHFLFLEIWNHPNNSITAQISIDYSLIEYEGLS